MSSPDIYLTTTEERVIYLRMFKEDMFEWLHSQPELVKSLVKETHEYHFFENLKTTLVSCEFYLNRDPMDIDSFMKTIKNLKDSSSLWFDKFIEDTTIYIDQWWEEKDFFPPDPEYTDDLAKRILFFVKDTVDRQLQKITFV